jgi:cytochrome bd-type quinol oxidase subunit 2
MIKKLKTLGISLTALATLLAPGLLASVPAFAATDIKGNLCSGTNIDVTGGSKGDCSGGAGTSSLNKLLTQAVNIFSAIVGVIAVIMIIVGGLKYITSGGDSNKVGAAKNTLIYAIIGLVIVALAQVIVHFVLQKANQIS